MFNENLHSENCAHSFGRALKFTRLGHLDSEILTKALFNWLYPRKLHLPSYHHRSPRIAFPPRPKYLDMSSHAVYFPQTTTSSIAKKTLVPMEDILLSGLIGLVPHLPLCHWRDKPLNLKKFYSSWLSISKWLFPWEIPEQICPTATILLS